MANRVLGWAVSINAGGRQLSLTAVPTTDTQTDRQRYAFAKICSARF